MGGIIKSLLDNDLYKFTMGQVVLRHFSDTTVRYGFVNRGKTQFPKGFAELVRQEIAEVAKLRFTDEELNYLSSACGKYLKPGYIGWLRGYQLKLEQVTVTQKGSDLQIWVEGPWYETIYWEVILMSIVSELYFRETSQEPTFDYIARAREKAQFLKANGVSYADFGTRRRYSFDVHDAVVRELAKYPKESLEGGGFVGTSNVYLAKKYGVKPIGTMAHELTMVMGAIYGVQSANEKMLSVWSEEFNGLLGTALTDTYTTEVFLRSFGVYYAKLFDGVRHDSGDPFAFVDRIVSHYKKLGINPLTKTVVFSDGLDPDIAVKLSQYCKGKILCSFGIGTNLSNDVGVKPLNIVIKVFFVILPDGTEIPTIKLSDTPGKHTGDRKMIETSKYLLRVA